MHIFLDLLLYRKSQRTNAEMTDMDVFANGAAKDDAKEQDVPFDDTTGYDNLVDDIADYDYPTFGDGHADRHHCEQPVTSGPRPSSNDKVGQRNVQKPPAYRPTTYLDLLDDEGKSGNIPKPPADRPTTYLDLLDDEGKSGNIPKPPADRPTTYLDLLDDEGKSGNIPKPPADTYMELLDDDANPDVPSPPQNIDGQHASFA